MTASAAKGPTWRDRGAAHFQSLRTHGKSTIPYPTQDTHTPKDEAEFIAGFQSERRKVLGAQIAEDAGDVEGC